MSPRGPNLCIWGLSKLSDIVKNCVFEKNLYNAKVKNIEDKIPDITNLPTITTLNAKIKVKGEIPSIINLDTKTARNLVKKTDYNTKN